jgi:hypothetical protein
MGGFKGHLPHSKTGIFKKIVGVLFEKIDFKDIHYWLYSGILHQFLYKALLRAKFLNFWDLSNSRHNNLSEK